MKKLLIFIAAISAFLLYAFCPRPYTYDAEKAGDYATANAARRSKSLCAMYVRQALETAGCNMWGHPHTAHGYNEFLKSLDFTRMDTKNYSPEKGDIVVFSAVKGHPYGHIAIWNGRQWVSDFRQKNLYVAGAYAAAGNQQYYRMTKKHPMRHFTLQHHLRALGAEPLSLLANTIKKHF